MKKIITVTAILVFGLLFSQKLDNIQSGESLQYRIHYGFLNAGTATLNTQKTTFRNTPHFHVKGVGKSTGLVKTFFPVNDVYESYMDYNTGLPSYYIRNVKEGNYTQHLETNFNHDSLTLTLTDKEKPAEKPKTLKTVKGIQDMLSAFYYLRSFDAGEIQVGKQFQINVWIDNELFPFQLKVAAAEDVKTKFGKINCLKIIPSVMSGRVFRAKEGVTLWVTNDSNHIPVTIKADLAVGSLKADLESYENVKYPLNFR
jgi:hypothetical protein